jgi:hypothetical protein
VLAYHINIWFVCNYSIQSYPFFLKITLLSNICS